VADETLKKLAEQFMNAGKSEEQRRRDRNASFIEDLLRGTKAADPFYGMPFPSVKQPEPEKPATRLVGCRGCGQVNRVPSVPVVGKKPVCGKCKGELS
jgi:formylmethanofuran dehydrogenase subunit E